MRPPDAHAHPECPPSRHSTLSAPKLPTHARGVNYESNLLTVRIEHSGIDGLRPPDRLPIQHSSSHSVRRRHENGLLLPAPPVRREDYYHNFESTQILANRSQQETSPDTSVEVNPVPPVGWRRMVDPYGNKGRAPLDFLQRENEPLTSSCSPTSTSPKITDLTRKPLPDCEIGQISPPNGCIASSINSKGEVGVTPKEPPIPSYATSHPQFDHAVSMGWNIAMFLVCGGWHEPEEPSIGPINVPLCLRGPGFVQDSTDGPELDVDGHLIQVPKSLTNGAEVVYDRATNLFMESEEDYDPDDDEDPGLCEEFSNAGQSGNYSTTGLTRNCEHADPPAEVLPHTEVPDADKAPPAPPGAPACDYIGLTSLLKGNAFSKANPRVNPSPHVSNPGLLPTEVPRAAKTSTALKTSSTPPDLPGGGGIEPTSPSKSITSLGSAPRDHASANPSPHASDPGELRLEMVQVPTSRGIAWALHAPQGLKALALRLKCSVDTLRKARFDSEDDMSETAHGERTSDPGMLRSIPMAQAAPTHHGEVRGPSTDLYSDTTSFQGHRRQSTAPPSPAVELPNADPAAPPRAPLTTDVPTREDGSGPPSTSCEESPPVAGGLAPQGQAGPLQMLYWLRFASAISIMIMISSALYAAISNVLTSRGEIAKASPATQAGGGEALPSGLPTTSEAPCEVRQPSATGSSDSITGLAKLKEGSYPPRIANSRGEIIHKTSVSASSGTHKVGSGLPTVLDVTKATARLESAEDAFFILKMATAPNAETHTLDTMAESKREIGPQGLTVALRDPVTTGPSPVSQLEAAIVTKLQGQSANSDAEGRVYDLSALRSPGLDLKQIDVDQDPRSRPPQAVGKPSTSSVIPIEVLLTPKSSYLADQGVTLGIEETLASTPSKITPSPTLKTEIVASPLTPTAEGHWPSPQDPGLLPECPEPKPKPPATAQGFTSSNGPENPGFKIPQALAKHAAGHPAKGPSTAAESPLASPKSTRASAATNSPVGPTATSAVLKADGHAMSSSLAGVHHPPHGPRGDTNSHSGQPSPIQVRSISPEGQPDPDLCLQGITGLLESMAKSTSVARTTSKIDPTLTLLTTGPVHPQTKTTSEPGNRVGEDLSGLPRTPDHHKLQEGRPPDRSPPSHGDRLNSSSSTTPAGASRLDRNPTNKVEPRPPSTRAQSGDSLKITKEAQHHGNLLFRDLHYGDAHMQTSRSWSTHEATDTTPTPTPTLQKLWHPTRQGHILCLA
jgi:hypothetical protein